MLKITSFQNLSTKKENKICVIGLILVAIICLIIFIFFCYKADQDKQNIMSLSSQSSNEKTQVEAQFIPVNEFTFQILNFQKSNNFIALEIFWLPNLFWSQDINVFVVKKEPILKIVAKFDAEYKLLSSKKAEISFLLNSKLQKLFQNLNKKEVLEKYTFKSDPSGRMNRYY